MKFHGYPAPYDTSIRWNPEALFLRQNGWLVFALPVIWVGIAAYLHHQSTDDLRRRIMIGVGVALAILTFIHYLGAAMFPFTRGLLLSH
ncbi:MAG: hypothetical protein KDM64_20025 [Verrucomicrobiae bacterium]|nr:hypothetical protein [Verrucomicrobiae bacterium]